MTRIAILTIGSRGDVQPFVALAWGLQRAGYDVMLGAPPDFRALASNYGIPFTPIGAGMQQLLQDQGMKQAIGSGNIVSFLRSRNARRHTIFAELHHDARRAAADADVIVYKNVLLAALGIARTQGVPCVEVRLQPFTPAREFPGFVLGGRASYGPVLNWLSGMLVQQVVWQLSRGDVSAFFREELGLAPPPLLGADIVQARAGVPVVHPISPTVLPSPASWPAYLHLTGYWFLPAPPGWQPPRDLEAFIAAGKPPVYVGFGSMPSQDPQAMRDLIVHALELAGQRGVVYGGWGGIAAHRHEGERALFIEGVPHAWLFPQMRAIVHHGGAGTTAAALLAGVPSVVVPFFADQPFWGWRTATLGAGPAPLPLQTLTAERLARALRQATTDPEMRRRAGAIGAQLRSEDGIARARQVIERAAGAGPATRPAARRPGAGPR